MPEFSAELEQLTDKRRKAMGKDIMDTGVGKVEVSWNGRIESVNFGFHPGRVLEQFENYFMQECDEYERETHESPVRAHASLYRRDGTDLHAR